MLGDMKGPLCEIILHQLNHLNNIYTARRLTSNARQLQTDKGINTLFKYTC